MPFGFSRIALRRHGLSSYYASGSPPLPGRWAARGLGYPLTTTFGPGPIYRRDYFGEENLFVGIMAGSYDFGDVDEAGRVTINGVVVGHIVNGNLVQSAAQKATADKLKEAATTASAIAAGSPPPAGTQVATAGVGAGLSAWLDKSTVLLGTSIKNSYLAAGGGLAALLLFGMKKKGRF